MDRIVFLDVDGVLVTRSSIAQATKAYNPDQLPWFRGYTQVDQDCASLFKAFVKKSASKVVLSSTWRTLPYVDTVFGKLGIDLYDMTPFYGDMPNTQGPGRRYSFTRGEEIHQWITKNNFQGDFIIIDDNTDVEPYRHRLVNTTMKDGFSLDSYLEALRMFELT